MTPSIGPRYHHLDALRAFAMLLGIVLHGFLSFVDLPLWPAQDIHQNTAVYGFLIDAIHGFRMPLFFLISGFFTAMLWRRRGARGLVKQRSVRILLPMIVGVIVIWPAIAVVGVWGGQVKSELAGQRAATREAPTILTIWDAARHGDIPKLNRFLDDGADPNGRSSLDISPLEWAALMDRSEAIEVLVEAGADIQAKNRNGDTALHAAAFLGRLQAVDKLVERGAEVTARNQKGETPWHAATADWIYVPFIAGVIGIEVDEASMKPAREQVADYLEGRGGKPVDGADKKAGDAVVSSSPTPEEIFLAGVFFPIFHHLWFLYYLLWLLAGFLVLALLVRWAGWKRAPAWMIDPPRCLLWVFPLTLLAQLFMLQAFGPDTAAGVIPWPPKLAYYGIFFFYGALCFGRSEWIDSVGKRWPLWLVVAAVSLLAGHHAFALRETDFLHYHSIASLAAVTYAWAMAFGLIGLLRQGFPAENARVRYLSDASYWLYITHLPLIIALQIAVSGWALPSAVKFLLIVSVTTGFLLACYARFVRYTFIGAILNGKKIRPEEKPEEAPGTA